MCSPRLQAVYNQMVSSAWDRRYIEALVQHVVPSIVDSQEVEVKIGAMNIPVPPANVGQSILTLLHSAYSLHA